MPIMLGPIKPWVMAAYQDISSKYPVSTAYGCPGSGRDGHAQGLAVDFMLGDPPNTNVAEGNAMLAYIRANAVRLGIDHVIWQQHIYYTGGRDYMMPDRHSINLNHLNHVHITCNATAPSGAGAVVNTGGFGGTPTASAVNVSNPLDALSGVTGALGWITTPKNLGRIALFILGGIMILIALDKLSSATQAISKTTKAVSNVAKP